MITRKLKAFGKAWAGSMRQGRHWRHLNKSQRRATLLTTSVTGSLLGAGAGSAIAPKGKRKRGAVVGGAWGSVTGIYGGVGTGIYYRTRKKKRRKR